MGQKNFKVKTSIMEGRTQRSSICLMGGKLFELKLKLDKKEKINKGDIRELRKYLGRIDKFDQKIWTQIKKQALDPLP